MSVFAAAKSGDLEKLFELLDDTVDRNDVDDEGRTLLCVAAEEGHVEIVDFLLKDEEVDRNKEDLYTNAPISVAMRNGHEKVVERLLKDGKVDRSPVGGYAAPFESPGAFGAQSGAPSNPPTFGGKGAKRTSTFGSPDAFGAQSAFGAPSNPPTFGGRGASAFASPDAFGAQSTFGAPSNPPTFGGEGANHTSTFGSPGAKGTGNLPYQPVSVEQLRLEDYENCATVGGGAFAFGSPDAFGARSTSPESTAANAAKIEAASNKAKVPILEAQLARPKIAQAALSTLRLSREKAWQSSIPAARAISFKAQVAESDLSNLSDSLKKATSSVQDAQERIASSLELVDQDVVDRDEARKSEIEAARAVVLCASKSGFTLNMANEIDQAVAVVSQWAKGGSDGAAQESVDSTAVAEWFADEFERRKNAIDATDAAASAMASAWTQIGVVDLDDRLTNLEAAIKAEEAFGPWEWPDMLKTGWSELCNMLQTCCDQFRAAEIIVKRGEPSVPTDATFRALKKERKEMRRVIDDANDSDDSDDSDNEAPAADLKERLREVERKLELQVIDLARAALGEWPELRLRYAKILGPVLSSGEGGVGVRNMDAFDNVEPIGGSGRVVVHAATLGDKRMAIKVFTLVGSREKEAFLKEVRMLRSLRHKYIAELTSVFVVDGKHDARGHIVMPLYAGGDLWAWKDSASPSSPEMLRVLWQALCALDHMHRNAVVHGDMKPQNVFVELSNNGPIARVGDFGVSKDDVARTMISTKNTIMYAAPELQEPGAKATSESDIYAFGLTLYDALCSTFACDRRDLDLKNLDEHDIIQSHGLRSFVARLLDADPANRPTSSTALVEPVFFIQPVERTEYVSCTVCFDDFWKDNGIVCKKGHAMCGSCVGGSLRAEIDKPLPYIQKRGGLLCGAGDCDDRDPFAIGELACATKDDATVLDAFLARLEEARKSEYHLTAQKQLEEALAEQARALAVETDDVAIRRHKVHIEEKILNLACPRCGMVFGKYTGCMALTCDSAEGDGGCGGYFCALCLTQSPTSRSNHDHVRKCPFNTHSNVFEAEGLHDRVQRDRRQRLVDAYLRDHVPSAMKERVMEAIAGSLDNLGIAL